MLPLASKLGSGKASRTPFTRYLLTGPNRVPTHHGASVSLSAKPRGAFGVYSKSALWGAGSGNPSSIQGWWSEYIHPLCGQLLFAFNKLPIPFHTISNFHW